MELRVNGLWVAVVVAMVAGCEVEPSTEGVGQTSGGSGGGGGAGSAPSGGGGGMSAHNVAGMIGHAGIGSGGVGAGGMDLVGSGGSAGVAGMSATGGMGGEGGDGPDDLCKAADAFVPLTPRDGETCHEFVMHDGDGTSKFVVQVDESYNQFYFDIPWEEDSVATRFGQVLDNSQVLHHWLGFVTDVGTPGTVSRNVLGTTIGENATLFGGWAVGGCNVEFPPNMGLQLDGPSSGKKVMIQWHHYNFTPEPQPDATRIQICTVPRSARPDIGSVTWLGTEDLGGNGLLGGGMPPGVESKFSGTCLNETQEEINIVAFLPHMHEIGTNMYTEVQRLNGSVEVVFNEPFRFDYQTHYELRPFVKLMPGDKIRAECTYFNKTEGNVAFGQSSKAEMCYQFAFAYPAGALEKPSNFSLIGATNTCWGD